MLSYFSCLPVCWLISRLNKMAHHRHTHTLTVRTGRLRRLPVLQDVGLAVLERGLPFLNGLVIIQGTQKVVNAQTNRCTTHGIRKYKRTQCRLSIHLFTLPRPPSKLEYRSFTMAGSVPSSRILAAASSPRA